MVRNLLKHRKSNSRLHFKNIQTRLKSKRSQESIGMSFNMIFSIILIIFFLVAAFVAIKYFLGMQKETQLRTYFESFQGKISELGSSAGIVGNEYVFEKNAPSGTTDLCYMDFNLPSSTTYSAADAEMVRKCTEIKENLRSVTNANFAFYSLNYDKIMKRAGYKTITGINAESLPDPGYNCYCITKNTTGKIKIKISTTTENPDVKIKSA